MRTQPQDDNVTATDNKTGLVAAPFNHEQTASRRRDATDKKRTSSLRLSITNKPRAGNATQPTRNELRRCAPLEQDQAAVATPSGANEWPGKDRSTANRRQPLLDDLAEHVERVVQPGHVPGVERRADSCVHLPNTPLPREPAAEQPHQAAVPVIGAAAGVHLDPAAELGLHRRR